MIDSNLTARQIAAIERWLRVFHPHGDAVEMRALNVQGKRAVCETFADPRALAVRAAELDAAGASGIYFTLNPICPDLVGSRASCRKADVTERRWLPLDIDPLRPKDCSSTEAELHAAWAVLDRCRGMLDAAGLRNPVVGHSGNGFHLCYPILLPNDDAAQTLLKAILKGLHARCGDQLSAEEAGAIKAGDALSVPKAKVEEDVHDAPRIWKLYGTMARKGVATDQRPHRYARWIEGVSWDRTIAEANARLLASLPDQWQAQADARRGRPQTDASSYAAAAMRQELATLAAAGNGQRNNQLNRSAHAIGTLVGSGAVERSLAEGELFTAGVALGLPEDEVRATVKSGLDAGSAKPRNLSAVGKGKAKPPAPPLPPDGERIIQRASEIEPTEVKWLWPGRIPLAKLTTFAGQTCQGKTFVAIDIAARVTRGVAWPDGKQATLSGQVLFLTGDDDMDDTLVPRMIEAGADLERVVFLTEAVQATWSMAALATLDRAIEQAGDHVALVVIDPPTSFLMGIDDHKNVELRGILTPFKEWAKRNNLAVIMITHVNKAAANTDAMSRVMGSVAWLTGVRTAYMFCADPDQPRSLFLTLKNNLGPKANGKPYEIVDGEKAGKVKWHDGEIETTADDALNKPKGNTSPRGATASEWVIERFREQLEWPSDELFERAKGEGISRNAMFEAKRFLDLPKPRKQVALDGSTSWTWWVPSDWPPLASYSTNQNCGTLGTLDDNPFV